ncbi:hypothetical protein HDE_01621 [Halotydeus destructor]|nr:hypothetical protein HDE_01621 [Halotydeus destructor]
MAWIVICLERFKLKLVVKCDLVELYNDLESLQSTGSRLQLHELHEDALTCIFGWLEVKNLVCIERVSKQFFHIVGKTFRKLKHIRRRDVEHAGPSGIPVVNPRLNPVAFINRFGPSLRTVPFNMLVPQLDSGQHYMRCETSYFKQLAFRFPEISDVGRLDDVTLDWLLVLAKAASHRSKLRKLYVYFSLSAIHLFDNEAFDKFRVKVNLILSLCPKLEKVKLGLDTDQAPRIEGRYDKFVTDFGRLSLELCSKINRLKVFDKAACAIKEYISQGPVNLQELKVVLFDSLYSSDGDVYELCHFAPNVRKITLRAEASALKHLTALRQLEAIEIATPHFHEVPFPASPESASKSMETFLKIQGKRLKKASLGLLNQEHVMPLTRWLSEYCPNLSKLKLGLKIDHDLTDLKLPSLTRFEYYVNANLNPKEFDTFLGNNRSLRIVKLICDEVEMVEKLKAYFKRTSSSRERTFRSLFVDVVASKDQIIESF